MDQNTIRPEILTVGSPDVLTDVLRQGARQMLLQAVEAEVADYLARHVQDVDAQGRRLVVRNGRAPVRTIQTPIGPLDIQMPRINDRRTDEEGHRCRFTSSILPKYLRKTKALEELIPWLYLKGISTGDMSEALAGLVGPSAAGLSATTVVRLKDQWQAEWQTWSRRPLSTPYVYVWADGVYFNVRLEGPENAHQCILVLMGATPAGKKELIALADGYRESEQSWRELLLDVKARGLLIDPKLAVGDGALGFWAALAKVYPATRRQRCWVHKTANVLNKLPGHLQKKAKAMLQEIYLAETKIQAQKAFDVFLETFTAKYPKATHCLAEDREVLLTFYDFPAEHWVHLRTTNPIESTFATVRLRTEKTKGCGTRTATFTMVFKLARSAEAFWRFLNGTPLLDDVIQGVKFVDGIKEIAA